MISMGLSAQNKKQNNNSTKIEKHEPMSNTFEKGQVDVNLGIGLLANRYYYNSGWRTSPPLNISIEKGITKNVSIGGYLAYVRSSYKYSSDYIYYNGTTFVSARYNDKYTVSYGVFGFRGAFHFAEYIQVENLDLYAGAMLGYSFAKYTWTTDNANGRVDPYSSRTYGGLVGSFYAGGRYRFNEKIGVYGEFGYGLAYGNIGVNFKF
jgi:hypothetical protein